MIGTLRYVAPELQRGEQATPRSDLYSLGIVLRECFGDEPPPALDELVTTLTAADPARRPDSAAAALARLGTAPEETVPMTASQTMRMPAAGQTVGPSDRGRKLGFLALGLIALGAVAAVALALGGGDGGDSTALPPTSTTTVTEPQDTAPAVPDLAPANGTVPPPAGEPPSCDELEQSKKQLEEEKKAAEEELGDDKEAKEAAKQQFEEKKHALDESIKACKEAEKAAAE